MRTHGLRCAIDTSILDILDNQQDSPGIELSGVFIYTK